MPDMKLRWQFSVTDKMLMKNWLRFFTYLAVLFLTD